MKRLLLLCLFPFLYTASIAQCTTCAVPDSITHITPDSVWEGSMFTLHLYWREQYGSSNNDTVFVHCFAKSANYLDSVVAYLTWEALDTTGSYGGGWGKAVLKVKLPMLNIDSTTFIAGVYAIDNQNQDVTPSSYFIGRRLVVGINPVSGTNYNPVQYVRYYNMLGQLYGQYAQRQTNLPHIPLIEEVVYRDQSVTTRNILHLN